MNFDLESSLRRLKPEKKTGRLERRGDPELSFVDGLASAGPPLLLDTTIYIDTLQSSLPDEVVRLMSVRRIDHSSIAVAELAHAFGRLDPEHPDTAHVLEPLRTAIVAIPNHRLAAPSLQSMVDAGVLAGAVSRLRGFTEATRQSLFNDAILFFQALERGCHLLSRNIADLDFFLQIFPMGRVLLYRQNPRST